jgi:two-component system, NtrC family, C4-dicarboxylate transport response regulator DctD
MRRHLSSSSGSSPVSILVVDDEPGLRRLACQTLERAGYVTLEAEDGAQALRLLEQHARLVALVVSDIRMPQVDGIELEQTCRERWPTLPVLLMSGEVTRDWVVRLVREDALPVLRKPFLGETLLDAVRSILHPPSGGASNLA